MKFTVAGRSYNISTKNRAGTLVVAPVTGISLYPYRDSENATAKLGINHILKVWIRTTSVQVSVGYAPQIGDIVAVMWTPHSRYNTDDIQYYIINEKHNNVPISLKEVIAHFGGNDVPEQSETNIFKT